MVVDACSAAAAAACAIFILPSRGKPAVRRVTVEVVRVNPPHHATASARRARLGTEEAGKADQHRQDADLCGQRRPRALMLRPPTCRRLEQSYTATMRCYSTSARRMERPPPLSALHTGACATVNTIVCALLCRRCGPVREGCPFPATQLIVKHVPCLSGVQQRLRESIVRMRCSHQPAALQRTDPQRLQATLEHSASNMPQLQMKLLQVNAPSSRFFRAAW